MRVHGDINISRRAISKKKSYKEYSEELKEDFHYMCGYCGKHMKEFLENPHIDHFAPQSKFSELRDEYKNLVLSCPRCNLLKSDKWEGPNAETPVVDDKGFVDPASADFDQHLCRKDDGSIIYKTDIGKYMSEVFKFELRPISLIWKVHKLYELEDILENDDSNEGAKYYKEINKELKAILKDLVYTVKE